jgi:osmotically-inducible protein OsmY
MAILLGAGAARVDRGQIGPDDLHASSAPRSGDASQTPGHAGLTAIKAAEREGVLGSTNAELQPPFEETTMNDTVLRDRVLAQLDFEPGVEAAHIGVAVDTGVVTLTGHVTNYAQKALVEAAVQRVVGVRGLAEELTVALDGSNPYSDDDIAERVLIVLDLNVLVPPNCIQVKVQRGWLTLSGKVDWYYQQSAAIDDLRKLRGVMGITNAIKIKPHADSGDVKQHIEAALKRTAEVEAGGVEVSVVGSKVTLRGTVRNWADRCTVERAAWSSPGVSLVEDHVTVA